MLMIRALHDPLDLQFIDDDVRVALYVGIAGMKNIFFVLRIEAEFFQIILSVKERVHPCLKDSNSLFDYSIDYYAE